MASKGVFVTTYGFGPHALDFVHHLSQRVILPDGQHLADFMTEDNVGFQFHLWLIVSASTRIK